MKNLSFKPTFISQILVATMLVSSSSAFALTVKQAFAGARQSPQCYNRVYDEAHLRAHPAQTVKAIKAQQQYDKEYNQSFLLLEVFFKDEPNASYRQVTNCQDVDGKVSCAVDCDGGKVEITAAQDGTILIKNEGIMVQGGCGSVRTDRYMKPVAGGDDIFRLNQINNAACEDLAKTNW